MLPQSVPRFGKSFAPPKTTHDATAKTVVPRQVQQNQGKRLFGFYGKTNLVILGIFRRVNVVLIALTQIPFQSRCCRPF